MSELVRRGYSEEEVTQIYELARLWLESGEIKKAEIVLSGLTEVAPDFAPGWLALSYVHIQNRNYDSAVSASRSALKVSPDMHEATLYLVACYMTLGDVNAAGTLLGEIGERIEAGMIDDPNVIRVYKLQLARFQSR